MDSTPFDTALAEAVELKAQAEEDIRTAAKALDKATQERDRLERVIVALQGIITGTAPPAPPRRTSYDSALNPEPTSTIRDSALKALHSTNPNQVDLVVQWVAASPSGLSRESIVSRFQQHSISKGWKNLRNSANTAIWRATKRGIVEHGPDGNLRIPGPLTGLLEPAKPAEAP